MIVVSISKKTKRFSEKKTLPTLCSVEVPLKFVNKISSGAIKELALANILTLEQLHLTPTSEVREKIKNRRLLQEVFDLRQHIQKMVKLAKHRNILFFEEKARNNNIKIRPSQRAELIGIAIFANLFKNVLEVLSYTLSKENPTKFREIALLKKVREITQKSILKAS